LWEREGQRGWHTEDFLFLLFPQRDFCGFRAGGVDIYNNGEWLVVSGDLGIACRTTGWDGM